MKFLTLTVLLIGSILSVYGQYRPELKDSQVPIVKQSYDLGHDGSYQWHYETGDGITANEHGALKNLGQKDEALEVQGSAGWTAPDGQHYEISYVADENGFQPQGNHLPTPPPVPEAILRSLNFIKNNPPYEEPHHGKSHQIQSSKGHHRF